GGDRTQQLAWLAAGFQPIDVPSWVNFGDWSTVRSLENGGVEFEFPDHVRHWEAFKDAIIADPRSQEITQAALQTPPLGAALPLFLSAIDSLIQGPTPQRLVTFHEMWLAFRAIIESLTAAQVLLPGIVDDISAIALGFEIELPDTVPAP
ncbi:MAG: hypothetical protein AAGF75_14450, partial [Cyanobacteria bacterium P01_H01_bin.130]